YGRSCRCSRAAWFARTSSWPQDLSHSRLLAIRTLAGTASPVFMASGDARGHGAHNRVRTDDLFLTKEVLCRLSYVGPRASRMEPTTGLEPGTGGLQNRCSTN